MTAFLPFLFEKTVSYPDESDTTDHDEEKHIWSIVSRDRDIHPEKSTDDRHDTRCYRDHRQTGYYLICLQIDERTIGIGERFDRLIE